MRLTERIYLVGGGRNGFGISEDFDCHVYLLDGGEELALIDAGAGRIIEPILANLRFDGIDTGRLRYILLTHAHADHAGAAAEWRRRFGVEVAASREAAQYVRDGDESRISLDIARQGGFYPPDYVFHACPVNRVLGENDIFRVGDLEVRVMETPGHCSGMLSFLVKDGNRTALFSGDTVFHDGRLLISNLWDCDLRQYARSIEKLALVDFDALLPGHQAIALTGGSSHVRKAWDSLSKMSIPPSII